MPTWQSIIWVFLLNNFSRIINLLLTKLARDRPGRISTLGLFCTDFAALGPYCPDLGPIFSQYGPRAWLIRYIYYMASSASGQDDPNRALHLARSGLPAVSRKQNYPESHIINLLLTKFARSRLLGIGLVLFLRVYGPRLRLGP